MQWIFKHRIPLASTNVSPWVLKTALGGSGSLNGVSCYRLRGFSYQCFKTNFDYPCMQWIFKCYIPLAYGGDPSSRSKHQIRSSSHALGQQVACLPIDYDEFLFKVYILKPSILTNNVPWKTSISWLSASIVNVGNICGQLLWKKPQNLCQILNSCWWNKHQNDTTKSSSIYL